MKGDKSAATFRFACDDLGVEFFVLGSKVEVCRGVSRDLCFEDCLCFAHASLKCLLT